MSRYREMEVFTTVANAGSLASAARQLAVSPATVMRTVAALEARLNTTLLRRGPRGVSLSPEGEGFAERCRFILEQTGEAERSALGLHRDPAGPLTVSMPLLMAHQLFMPLATDYLAAFPSARLLTQTREQLPKLLEEGIDIALVVGPLADSSGFAIPVGAVRPIICASPAYLAQWGRPARPEDLRGHRSVQVTASGISADWRLPSDAGPRVARTVPILACSTQQAAIGAATAGLGLVRCMSYEAHEQLQAGLLEAILPQCAGAALPAQLVYREGRNACARVRTFIDYAVPWLRAHPALHA